MGFFQFCLIAFLAVIFQSGNSMGHPESNSLTFWTSPNATAKDTTNGCYSEAVVVVASPCCNAGDHSQQCCPAFGADVLNCFFFSQFNVQQVVSLVPVSGVIPCGSGGQYCTNGDKCVTLVDVSNSGSPSYFKSECCSASTEQDDYNDYNSVNQNVQCSNQIICDMSTGMSSDSKYMCCSGDCNSISSGS